ncbi:hypothetical protein [Methylobacterium sp. SyP6R]|uniref:hypothetical protein n=1 Tax=Methylobacterium sp. SyP6R TaxID=2718876 RepID=UPI001F393783|nr:hypothetical protein [Methylobacterium sp. SyP6R]MCF4124958.1 hypothetical protein [Methylobacterium sp. SyP6R]
MILDRYLARTRALADPAIANWEKSPQTQFANRLQTRAQAASPRQEKTSAARKLSGAPE